MKDVNEVSKWILNGEPDLTRGMWVVCKDGGQFIPTSPLIKR